MFLRNLELLNSATITFDWRGAYDTMIFGILQFFARYVVVKLARETKISNFMKNVDSTTVICDKIDGITVI